MCLFGSSKPKPKYMTVTILNVDNSVEDIKQPIAFFSHQWVSEILGSANIQAIKIDRTREIWFANGSKFKNDNATHFIQISETKNVKPIVFGAAILAPQGLSLPQGC